MSTIFHSRPHLAGKSPRRRRGTAILAAVVALCFGLAACETPGTPCTGVLKSHVQRAQESVMQGLLEQHYSDEGPTLTDDQVTWAWAVLNHLYFQPRWAVGDREADRDSGETVVCAEAGTWRLVGSTNTTTTTTTTAPAPIAVTTISPATGTTAVEVQITGTGFTGATSVTFGGTGAYEFTVVNDTRILATVPHGSGTVGVTVVSPKGTATKANAFTYVVG